jgi:predicted kinase
MSNLILVRGLPGSGKSTLAKLLQEGGGCITSADDYFTTSTGEYNFNPSLLPQAHAQCQDRTKQYLWEGDVIVANTFSQRWEIQPYIQIATDAHARLTVVDLFDGGLTDAELALRNIHGVPVAGISAMRARWEHDWAKGNPIAPWLR